MGDLYPLSLSLSHTLSLSFPVCLFMHPKHTHMHIKKEWWRNFFAPFLPFIALISVFCLTDGTARKLQDYSLFTSLIQLFTLEHMKTGIVRESAHGRGTREDCSTVNFGRVRAWTPPAVWQESALSILLCPLGMMEKLGPTMLDGKWSKRLHHNHQQEILSSSKIEWHKWHKMLSKCCQTCFLSWLLGLIWIKSHVTNHDRDCLLQVIRPEPTGTNFKLEN